MQGTLSTFSKCPVKMLRIDGEEALLYSHWKPRPSQIAAVISAGLPGFVGVVVLVSRVAIEQHSTALIAGDRSLLENLNCNIKYLEGIQIITRLCEWRMPRLLKLSFALV